jgi:hypothetical protein
MFRFISDHYKVLEFLIKIYEGVDKFCQTCIMTSTYFLFVVQF